jgi:hypothetical protein
LRPTNDPFPDASVVFWLSFFPLLCSASPLCLCLCHFDLDARELAFFFPFLFYSGSYLSSFVRLMRSCPLFCPSRFDSTCVEGGLNLFIRSRSVFVLELDRVDADADGDLILINSRKSFD